MNNVLIRIMGWKAMVLHGDPLQLDRWNWLKRRLAPGALRTLDAGCGSGVYTMYAATLGNDSIGISSDKTNNGNAEYRAAILRIPNVKFITADLRDLKKLKPEIGLFDQIICLDTIEHIKNDEKLIEAFSSLLVPGGRIFLTTFYKNYKHLVNDKISENEDGGHVRWGYTHEEIKILLAKHDIHIETVEYISGFISQQLTNAARLLGKINKKFAWAVTSPFKILQIFDPPITSLIGYPYSGIAVTGIKRKRWSPSRPN
ncbi:MAG: class I SAM-dependent methyltransferase [Candidatus Omnitrophica bacterium]|nr:class I SAM-dependent methyltransferase [Candidatus Omnitrophota bacterium]